MDYLLDVVLEEVVELLLSWLTYGTLIEEFYEVDVLVVEGALLEILNSLSVLIFTFVVYDCL